MPWESPPPPTQGAGTSGERWRAGRSELPAGARNVDVCRVQVYIEDSLGERIWVDSPHCKTFVDNVQTAFNTKMPPKSMLLQGEVGRSGGDLSAGERHRWPGWGEDGVPVREGLGSPPSAEPGVGRGGCSWDGWGEGGCPRVALCAGGSPHPSLTEEEDSQTELLIAEEKLSPEQEGQLMPR